MRRGSHDRGGRARYFGAQRPPGDAETLVEGRAVSLRRYPFSPVVNDIRAFVAELLDVFLGPRLGFLVGFESQEYTRFVSQI